MIAKNVLITGAAKRIGRAMAHDLAQAGWNVAVHFGVSQDAAEQTAAELRKYGVTAVTVKADLSRESETKTLISRTISALGPLSALINSASVFEQDDWQSADRTSWDRHIETNLRAPFVLSQAFGQALQRESEGAIVNLLDQRVLNPSPDFLSYGVSRAGLHWLTVTLAQALAPRIRVNAVAPGPTLKAAHQSEMHFEQERMSTILHRGSEPQDICGAVRYLLGARAVTGQTIAVDGGQHLIWQAQAGAAGE